MSVDLAARRAAPPLPGHSSPGPRAGGAEARGPGAAPEQESGTSLLAGGWAGLGQGVIWKSLRAFPPPVCLCLSCIEHEQPLPCPSPGSSKSPHTPGFPSLTCSPSMLCVWGGSRSVLGRFPTSHRDLPQPASPGARCLAAAPPRRTAFATLPILITPSQAACPLLKQGLRLVSFP